MNSYTIFWMMIALCTGACLVGLVGGIGGIVRAIRGFARFRRRDDFGRSRAGRHGCRGRRGGLAATGEWVAFGLSVAAALLGVWGFFVKWNEVNHWPSQTMQETLFYFAVLSAIAMVCLRPVLGLAKGTASRTGSGRSCWVW